MRSQLVRWLLTASLAGGTLISVATDASAQPGVRDHRKGGPKGPPVVVAPPVVGDPRDAPPPPRAEKIGKRRNFVWVTGQWEWNGGKWEWQAGHWERERHGKRWRERRWEKKGDIWVKIDGDWIDVDLHPTAAPPALQEEKWQPRSGFVWVRGNWDWQNGKWTWVAGHWERERSGKRWREPKWELQGGAWILVNGDWIDAPKFPTAAPPAPQPEKIGTRRGFIWVSGRWDWRNGDWAWTAGHWERERAKLTWQEGRWENKGGQWVWVEGSWVAAAPAVVVAPPVVVAQFPTAAPPALQVETVAPKSGFVWVRGRWDWKAGKWEWVAGHWERERANQRWIDGRWESKNNQWIWVEGSWGANAQPPPTVTPPAPPPVVVAPPPAPPVVVAPPPPPPGPTVAPPAPQAEAVAPRSGFVWIRGHWGWSANNKYEWIAGHWERERANVRWTDGRWDQRTQGNVKYWVWIEGSWR